VIGTIYIALNYALSKLAEYTQRRLARGRKAPRSAVGTQPPAAVAADA
jgi:glutamate transport system permease protein